MGILKVRSTSVYLHGPVSMILDTLTTFAVEMGLEPRASQLTLGLDSQISVFMSAEHTGSRIRNEETIAETPMHAVCEVITQIGSTRKANGARGQRGV